MRRGAWGAGLALLVAIGSASALDYRVRAGDTLSELAERFHTTVGEIKANNGLRSNTIVIGAVLRFPDASASSDDSQDDASPIHVVRSGESLWMIALKYRVPTTQLMRENGLRSDVIQPGDRLRIPRAGEPTEDRETRPDPVTPTRSVNGVSADDLEILARIIKGEVPNDAPFAGKVAVAAVVLNRVGRPGYPSTIAAVAHQPMQFSCYNRNVRGRLYGGHIPEAAWEAARAAAAGQDPSRGATHYFNPHLVRPSWARTMHFTVRIGTHSYDTHDFYIAR